jgi:hypothetical protein
MKPFQAGIARQLLPDSENLAARAAILARYRNPSGGEDDLAEHGVCAGSRFENFATPNLDKCQGLQNWRA